MTAAWLCLASLLAVAGFGALALAMPRHWNEVTDAACDVVPARRLLHASGAALITVSVCVCWWRDGPAFGSVLALLVATAAAAAVAQLLAWRPHWLRPLLAGALR